MPRRKAPGTKKPAGRKNDFVGKKLLLLTNFAGLWRQAIDCGEQSDFYDKITTLAVNRWGYHENYGSLTDDPDDESDNDIPSAFPAEEEEEGEDDLTAAEAKRRQIIYKKLRTKLGQWYRRKYLHVPTTTENSTPDILGGSLAGLLPSAVIPKAPRKLAEVSRYMRMYYDTRLSDEAERRIIIAQRNFDEATEEERTAKGMKKPVAVAIRAETARLFWETEQESTREEVRASVEDIHVQAMDSWAAKQEVPKTALEYHHQLQTAGEFLQPIAKAIAKMMGIPVAIMMPVPIPEKNGDIECLSVHANKPGALESSTWYGQDPLGYEAAETSLIAWARTQFTVEELRSRSLSTRTPTAPARAHTPTAPIPIPIPVLSPVPPRTPPQIEPQPLCPSPSLISPQFRPRSHSLSVSPSPRRPWPVRRSPPQEDYTGIHSPPEMIPDRLVQPPLTASETPEIPLSSTQPGLGLLLDTSSWPQHASDVYNYLTSETIIGEKGENVVVARGWGDEWLACVKEFMEFQKLAGFPDEGAAFPAKGKPTEVSYWQKCHRPWKDQPLRMKALTQFESDWWSWWKSLQPSARGANDGERMRPSSIDMVWTTLRAPGRNGFLLVMVSLTWWGKISWRSNAWQLAVADVTGTLVCLRAQPLQPPASVASTSAPLKRKRPLAQATSSSVNSSHINVLTSPRKLRKKKT